jgi:RimJ/RimL family protein N-acetyltransferase
MELMPYQDLPDVDAVMASVQAVVPSCTDARRLAAPVEWRAGLPTIAGFGCTLREVQMTDAPSLLAHLTTPQVSEFISPPPTTVGGFERFIAWAHRERSAGRYACFAVIPDGQSHAVGVFQVRVSDGRDAVAEWGFILGEAYWGTGLFVAGACHVIVFAFDQMGLERLEARASTKNGRGNGALRKLGAVPEVRLRQSFERHGARHDQWLWAILRDAWNPAHSPHPDVRRH